MQKQINTHEQCKKQKKIIFSNHIIIHEKRTEEKL